MSKAMFLIKGPSGQSYNYVMDKNFITIGRDPANDIPLEDKFSSKKHSKVTYHPDNTLRVTDMESHNGTKVNGQKIVEHILKPGDIIEVGHSQITFMGTPSEVQMPQQTPPVSPVPPYTPQPDPNQMVFQQAPIQPYAGTAMQPQPNTGLGAAPAFETPVQRVEEEIVPAAGASGRAVGFAKLLVPFAILALVVIAGLLLRDYLFEAREKVVGKYMKAGEYKIFPVDPFIGAPVVTDKEVVELSDLGKKIEIGVKALKRGNTDIVLNTQNEMKFILRITVLPADETGEEAGTEEILSNKQREERAKALLLKGDNCRANNEVYDARSFYKQVMDMLEPVGVNKDYQAAEEKWFETNQLLEEQLKELKSRAKAFANTKDYGKAIEACAEIKNIFHDPKDKNYMEADNMIERFKTFLKNQ